MNPNFPTKQALLSTATRTSLYPRLGNIDLIKTLNYGVTSKVKLGRDSATNKEFAVKIIKSEFRDKFLATVEQEAKFLSLVSQEEHPHVVKLIECRPKADYIKKNGINKKVFALIFEFAEGGDLFECIRAIGDFQEDIARTYFHQLISTVDYLHDKEIIHGDLKLENLLLGVDFSLKIADFSFASFALEGSNTAAQRQRLGSVNYMAPEVLANTECVAQSLDLFACGVILFLMVVRQSPFDKACLQDTKYKMIMKQQFAAFWKQFEVRNRSFNEDFKDLINAMLSSEPSQRLTIAEIKSHPWYQGKICSTEELKNEYELRKQNFLKYQEEKAKEMKKVKEAKAIKKKEIENNMLKPKLNSFAMRGIAPLTRGNIEQAVDQEIKERLSATDFSKERIAREYVFTTFNPLSEHFYDISQDTMFKLILLLSDSLFNSYKVYSAEYKIKGRVVSANNDFTGEILINITQLDEYSCCVSVTKVKGPLLPFYKFIEETLDVSIDKTLKTFIEKK